MSWIRLIDEGDADERLAALYGQMADPATGRVDNVLKVHGLHPDGLAAHWTLYRAAMRPTAGLPKSAREMIAVVVSRLNGCVY